LALEIHFQYKRKPARCHATTVRGVTRTRGLFHPDQSCRRRTQNSLCIADNRGRGRLACRARSCSRRARFSRTSSAREPKARIAKLRRCRSDENMAEIVPELRQQNRFQLAHFKSARPFDEEHDQTTFRVMRSCRPPQLIRRYSRYHRPIVPLRRFCCDAGSDSC
jgi:hypothetical protein